MKYKRRPACIRKVRFDANHQVQTPEVQLHSTLRRPLRTSGNHPHFSLAAVGTFFTTKLGLVNYVENNFDVAAVVWICGVGWNADLDSSEVLSESRASLTEFLECSSRLVKLIKGLWCGIITQAGITKFATPLSFASRDSKSKPWHSIWLLPGTEMANIYFPPNSGYWWGCYEPEPG